MIVRIAPAELLHEQFPQVPIHQLRFGNQADRLFEHALKAKAAIVQLEKTIRFRMRGIGRSPGVALLDDGMLNHIPRLLSIDQNSE